MKNQDLKDCCNLIAAVDDSTKMDLSYEQSNLEQRIKLCDTPEARRAELNSTAERLNKLQVCTLVCDTAVKVLKIFSYVITLKMSNDSSQQS